MPKKKNNGEIIPSCNGGLFRDIINSPAFDSFGQKSGDELIMKRANGDNLNVKRTPNNRTVAKASIGGNKLHQTLYDNGTDVGGYSNKNKKK